MFLPEPPVIKDRLIVPSDVPWKSQNVKTYQLAAEITARLGDSVNLLVVVLEFGCFPVVDEYGSIFVRPSRSCQMISVQTVE